MQRGPEGGGAQASSTPQKTLWAKRIGGGVANLVLVTAPWILIELLVDPDILEYPTGVNRLIAPLAAAVFNSWVIPLLTPLIVMHGEFAKESRGTQILVRTLLGRLANMVIIVRRSFLTLMSEERVWKTSLTPDTCYCEDEVGVTLFYYWGFDWAAAVLKCVAVPLLYFLRAKLAEPRPTARSRRRQQLSWAAQWAAFEKPELDIASWVVDHTSAQILLLLAIPLLPVSVFFGLLAGAYGFAMQRLVVVNFWSTPTKVLYPALTVRLAYSLATCFGLLLATFVYCYIWLHVSTVALEAPICQLPVLFVNATNGATCDLDATTGGAVSTSCAPYRETACAGRGTTEGDLALYQLEKPSAVMDAGLTDVAEVFGSAPLAWGIFVLLAVRATIQRNYRARFQAYVEEKRYLLLLQVANLEKTVKKQDKILAIQWNE